MILRVTRADLCGPQSLSLTFNDGTSGVADLSDLLCGSIFEPLREETYFARMELDRTCGTVAWPNGADIAPEALRQLVRKEAFEPVSE